MNSTRHVSEDRAYVNKRKSKIKSKIRKKSRSKSKIRRKIMLADSYS